MGELSKRQFPVGPFLTEFLGDRDRAAQRVSDRGRTGEQRKRPRRAIGVSGPQNFATWLLEVEHECNRAVDDRPHRLDEPLIAVQEEVMPGASGDVGDDVGVELVLLDLVLEVVLMPRPVGALDVDEPLVGEFGLGSMLTDRERHCRFDMVPRVGMATGEPRDHP